MENPKMSLNLNHAPVNPALMAAIRARPAGAPLPKLTGEPIVLCWTEPTPPEDVHPDDWIDHLPARPKRLPSRYRLARMTKGKRAVVLIMQIVSAALEIEGARLGRFEMPCDPEDRERFARNARRRMTRAIKRALEFGLWKNGRWQIGNLASVIDSLDRQDVNRG